MIEEKLVISCDQGSTHILLIIFYGIQVKGEYRWRRFILDRRQDFTDYSTVVPSEQVSTRIAETSFA
ncbi:hypothetical protein Hanom_Chr12g01090171 [Helianthus anomalus]